MLKVTLILKKKQRFIFYLLQKQEQIAIYSIINVHPLIREASALGGLTFTHIDIQ